MSVTRCRQCNKPLALNKTAWTCGPMFCSHKCGVNWAMTKYAPDEYKLHEELFDKATAYFNDIAEEINREDYGATVEIIPVYSAEHDITTLFEHVSEGADAISMTCVGWHYGTPEKDIEDDAIANGMTAVFVD